MQNELTRPLEVIETEINFYKQQTATGIIEIGKRLNEARKQLGEGETFSNWLTKMDFSRRSAYRFISVASEFSNVPTLAQTSISKLYALLEIPQEERDSFISTPHSTPSGEEKTIEEMTTREVEKAVKEWKQKVEEKDNLLKQKENELQKERNKEPKVIDNTDYKTINSLKLELSNKSKDIEILVRDKNLLERKVKLNEEDAKKFKELKDQIEFLSKEKENISRQIKSATELSALAVKIDNFLKTELSPIRYSRTLERMDSEVAINNLEDIIISVESWCRDMKKYLPNGNIVNNMEVIDIYE